MLVSMVHPDACVSTESDIVNIIMAGVEAVGVKDITESGIYVGLPPVKKEIG